MGLDSYVARQIAAPSGRLAPLVARLLNAGNRQLNLAAIDALDLRPGMRVLDVGFGGGGSLPELSERVGAAGAVAGIDVSPAMVDRGRAVFRRLVETGRLALELGSVESMPWPDAAFDGALSVNAIFYWPDTAAGLREVWRVLRPAGVFALAMRSHQAVARARPERFGFKNYQADELAALLGAAGWTGITSRGLPGGLHGNAVVVRAIKPST
ncbi:MAG TPA: methyltransferase domain-containing protein [Thermoanaerobaculia bacterium]|nr:methyltransferase domain-containing protein [Thermoanaerobaculia bacterium]